MDPVEETNRLLARLVRMQCETQAGAILELSRSGFSASRIAELLGTTSNTANVTIQRAKRSAAGGTRGGKRRSVKADTEAKELGDHA
jgi:DNA-directed RNA polymerase specialized sigma24 family protein